MHRPKQHLFWLMAILGSLLVGSVRADVISVTNPGFEGLTGTPNSTYFDASGNLRDGHFASNFNFGSPNQIVTANPIPGWALTSTIAGTFNPTTAFFPGEAPEGQNIAFLDNGRISQVLSEVLRVGTYTLRVDVGDRLDTLFPGYAVQFLAGGVLLAQDAGTLTPANGTFLTSTVTYSSLAGNPLLGQSLEIRLVTNGIQTDFDNVRLDGPTGTTVIPEPGTFALLGVGVAGLLGYRLRRMTRHSAAR